MFRDHIRAVTPVTGDSGNAAPFIDFLVAYIFPKDLWYVFPVASVEHRKVMCLTPGSKRSQFEQYREAWNLMGPTNTVPVSAGSNPGENAEPDAEPAGKAPVANAAVL